MGDNETCGWGSPHDDPFDDDNDDGDNEMCGWGSLGSGRATKSKRPRDPLYYHMHISFISRLGMSEKAIHIKYTENLNIWIPLSICRNIESDCMDVHREIFLSLKAKAKEQTVVPTHFRKPRMFK